MVKNERLQREYDLKLNAVRAQREKLRRERERERERSQHLTSEPEREPELKSERVQPNSTILSPRPVPPEALTPPTEYVCQKCTYINKLTYFRGKLRSKVCEICETPFDGGFVVRWLGT